VLPRVRLFVYIERSAPDLGSETCVRRTTNLRHRTRRMHAATRGKANDDSRGPDRVLFARMRVQSFFILVFASVVIARSAAAAPPRPEPLVFVTAEASGQVAVIDQAKGEVTDTIKVGARPRGLRLSRDGRLLFVAVGGPAKAAARGPTPPGDADAAGLAIIDVAGRKLMRKVAAGSSPFDVDLSTDGRTAFVSNNDTNEVTVLDIAKGTVKKKMSVGMEPEGIAVRPDGKVVYAVSHAVDEIYALDTKTMKLVLRVDAGIRPHAVVFARRGDVAFVTDEGFPAVSILDAKKHAEREEIAIPKLPQATPPAGAQGAALSPDGKRLYVTTGGGRSVVVVDVAKQAVVARIEGVGAYPRGIAASADGAKLFTANGSSNDVAVIDVASGKVEKRIKVPGAPWGVVVSAK